MNFGGKDARLALALAFVCAGLNVPQGAVAATNEYGDALGMHINELVDASVGQSDLRGIGVFSTPLAGFPHEGTDFVIMSTGYAASAYLPDTNNKEALRRGGARDDMTATLDGLSTHRGEDMVQLVLDLRVPGWAKGLAFDFQFFTEEWPDYFGFPFNDTFVAQVGSEPITIGLDGTVTAPGNVAFDTNGRLVSVDVGFGLDATVPNPDTGTTYDGTTGLLTTRFAIPEGQNRLTLTLSLFDTGDSIVDSAVFVDNVRFLREAPPTPVTERAGGGSATPGDPPAYGKITVGAGGLAGDDAVAISGNLFAPEGGAARGHWMVVTETMVLKPDEISFVTFIADGADGYGSPWVAYNTAYFDGAGSLNGEAGYTFRVWLTDRGEPGGADSFRVEVTAPDGSVVLDRSGTLQSGNIQIHPPGPR